MEKNKRFYRKLGVDVKSLLETKIGFSHQSNWCFRENKSIPRSKETERIVVVNNKDTKKNNNCLLNDKRGEANSTFSNFSEDLSHKNEDLKPDLDAVRRVLKAKKKRKNPQENNRKWKWPSGFIVLSSVSVKTHITTAEISTTEQLTAKSLNIMAYKWKKIDDIPFRT